MNAPLKVSEPSPKYVAEAQPQLRRGFELLASAPEGVKTLRELILSLAVRGKLVSQIIDEEPASELLRRIDEVKASRQSKRASTLGEGMAHEAPFSVPSRWRWARLSDIGQIVGGGTPKSDDSTLWATSGVPWLTPADLYGLKSKYIARGRRDISKKGLSNSSAQLMPAGAVLFSSRAPIGYVAVSANPLATNQGFKSCVPYIEDVADFVYWYLKWAAKSIDESASGTTFKEISGSAFGKVLIPLPPLAEQQRIVARVEELMKLCDALEENGRLEAEQHARLVSALFDSLVASVSPEELSKNWARVAEHFDLLLDRPEAVDALEQTILQLAVRGLLSEAEKKRGLYAAPKRRGTVELRDVCLLITDGEHATPARIDDRRAVPLVTAKNVRSEYIDLSVTDFVVRDVAEKCWKRCKPRRGDILMVSVGATLGRLCILEKDIEMVLVRSVTVIRPNPSTLDPRYLALHLMSPDSQAEIWKSVKQSAQPCLYLSKTSALSLSLPPLAEQRRTVARVEELRGMCTALREQLTAARETQSRLADALVEDATA